MVARKPDGKRGLSYFLKSRAVPAGLLAQIIQIHYKHKRGNDSRPAMLPRQYDTKLIDAATVLRLYPATFDVVQPSPIE